MACLVGSNARAALNSGPATSRRRRSTSKPIDARRAAAPMLRRVEPAVNYEPEERLRKKAPFVFKPTQLASGETRAAAGLGQSLRQAFGETRLFVRTEEMTDLDALAARHQRQPPNAELLMILLMEADP